MTEPAPPPRTQPARKADVVICECFARDGLQHEDTFVPTADKIALIDMMSAAGFTRIEATSYSNPQHVPAFRDASEVLAGISKREGVYYKATCPNVRAVRRALDDVAAGHGANELSLLVSASESHSQRNLRAGRDQQWEKIAAMVETAGENFRLIGVISVAFGCPFEGRVDPASVLAMVERFGLLGVRHVALADTTGLATPTAVKSLFRAVLSDLPGIVPIAHFHDSRGAGLANCVAALEAGCTHFDSAIGGVGGHPSQIAYGGGWTGNVATEDLVGLFGAMGVPMGLDLDALMHASRACERVLGRELHSKVARTGFGVLNESAHVTA